MTDSGAGGAGLGLDRDTLDRLAVLDDVLAESDPVPSHLTAYAASLLDFDRDSADLIELVAATSDSLSAVRSDDQERVLPFTGETVSVELVFGTDGILSGYIVPGARATGRLQTPRETTDFVVSDHGEFHMPIPSGPFRILLETEGVKTPVIDQ